MKKHDDTKRKNSFNEDPPFMNKTQTHGMYSAKKCSFTIIFVIMILLVCSACGASDWVGDDDTPIAQPHITEPPIVQSPTVQPTVEIQEPAQGIAVDDMRDGFPYILSGDTIIRLDCIGPYYELCYFINHENFERIPKLAADEQLIIRTERNDFDHVVLEPIEISYSEFVCPYIRFYYNYDGQLVLYSEGRVIQGKDLEQGNYDVENTNLPFWYINNSLMHTDTYFLYSNDSPTEYTVGYWEGTQYSEITLETTHIPFTKTSRIECYFTRTRNGYSIIDLSDYESGYYIITGCSYKKGENGGHGYLVYIE